MSPTLAFQLVFNVSAITWCIFFVVKMRRLMDENVELRKRLYGAVYFANVLAERGVSVTCDDCGNPIHASDQLDIIELDNGKTYVGHRSHGRGFEERLKGREAREW